MLSTRVHYYYSILNDDLVYTTRALMIRTLYNCLFIKRYLNENYISKYMDRVQFGDPIPAT